MPASFATRSAASPRSSAGTGTGKGVSSPCFNDANCLSLAAILSRIIEHLTMLWIIENQLGRRNLSDFQFKLLVGQEYELEHKLEGRPKQNESIPGKLDQNDHLISTKILKGLIYTHSIIQSSCRSEQ